MKKEFICNDSCVNNYIRSIELIPPYNAEQNRECALRIRAGDENAKKEMVEHNLMLVVSVAVKCRTYNLDCGLMERISAGNLGLIKAVEKYNPKRKESFSTYAVYVIRTAICNYSYTSDGVMRGKEYDRKLLDKFKHGFYQKHQRYPTQDECCSELGWTPKRLRTTLSYSKHIALDAPAPVYNDEKITLKEIISDKTISVEEKYETKKLIEDLESYVKKGARKHDEAVFRGVILEGKTLDEVSKELGVSRQRVNEVKNKVSRKLKRVIDKELLTDGI